MKSNFEFLNRYWPTLAQIGATAENYLYSDPNACIYKLGMFGERLILEIFAFEHKVTEKIYNLSSPSIKPYRAKVWEDVVKILKELETNPVNEAYFLQKLQDSVSKNAPFSACAIACVNSLAPDYIKEKLDLTL